MSNTSEHQVSYMKLCSRRRDPIEYLKNNNRNKLSYYTSDNIPSCMPDTEETKYFMETIEKDVDKQLEDNTSKHKPVDNSMALVPVISPNTEFHTIAPKGNSCLKELHKMVNDVYQNKETSKETLKETSKETPKEIFQDPTMEIINKALTAHCDDTDTKFRQLNNILSNSAQVWNIIIPCYFNVSGEKDLFDESIYYFGNEVNHAILTFKIYLYKQKLLVETIQCFDENEDWDTIKNESIQAILLEKGFPASDDLTCIAHDCGTRLKITFACLPSGTRWSTNGDWSIFSPNHIYRFSLDDQITQYPFKKSVIADMLDEYNLDSHRTGVPCPVWELNFNACRWFTEIPFNFGDPYLKTEYANWCKNTAMSCIKKIEDDMKILGIKGLTLFDIWQNLFDIDFQAKKHHNIIRNYPCYPADIARDYHNYMG
jgi:hypothetical protein